MKQHPGSFYNQFASFYPIIDLFLNPQKRKLFSEVNKYPYGRLLEIGVGNGSHLKYYTTHQIVGVDTSAVMLNRAKRQQQPGIQLLQMNGETLLFPDDAFDYVVLSHVIAVVDDPEKLLEETYRVLKPGGKVFILNHFTPDNWLKYLDCSFQKFSSLFHFKSEFYISSLKKLEKFRLLSELSVGLFSYFKILTYEKNL